MNKYILTLATSAAAVQLAACTTMPTSGPLPDLVVGSLSPSISAGAPGQAFNIAGSLDNIGTATIDRVPGMATTSANFYLHDTDGTRISGADGAWVDFGGVGFGDPFTPGSSFPFSMPRTVPSGVAPGPYQICAFIDSGEQILESDETNNETCAPFSILDASALADIVMVELSATPSRVRRGETFELASAYSNEGAQDVPAPPGPENFVSTSADITLKTLDGESVPRADGEFGGYVAGWGRTEDLRVGQTHRNRETVSAPTDIPPGEYLLCADVDLANNVPESDETNNRLCTPFTLLP
ncbi:MAG: CARDB domain-containing protein [Pseudomonadota bacterium]